ncbi:putative nucleotidyltransferase substrate binding domain-containing protein [Celerinatantimonas sp. YJH-8]|uniref:putative nucleotidyltransferase substrate binding domain-containing protein n=1 Tax=Celerinatantimonas sp. YJH-8 TaxID=3228714 RepID=UPI0038C69B5E
MNDTLLPNVTSFLKSISPFNQLPDEVLDAIASEASILYLAAQDSLPIEPESKHYLYILRSGEVEQRNPDGSLRSRLGTKDIFGFSLHQSQDHPSYRVNALKNSLLYRFNYTELLRAVADYPRVSEQLALSANQRLNSSINVKFSGEKSLFFQKISTVASHNIVVAPSAMSIKEVAYQMRHEHACSCCVIVDQEQLQGMVTDKDMTKRVVALGVDTSQPISTIMTRSPHTIAQDELVLSAMQMMMQYQIQNIPVLNDQQQVMGVITPQQLVHKHSIQAVFLIEKITHCQSLDELEKQAVERQAIFEAMAESDLPGQVIGQVMSLIYDTFTQQLLGMAETVFGKPPCDYVWIAAGSHARKEIHLASDQDNALILDDTATESDQMFFHHVAMYVCKGLDQCGYAVCSGRFMATVARWCQRVEIWQHYYRKWAKNPEYEMLLNLTVYLDIRPIYGNQALFEKVDQYRLQQVTHNHKLMAALVRNTLRTRPPLGIFNHVVLEKNGANQNKLNIKRSAIGCLVDLARIYTLYEGGDPLNTEERIQFAKDQGVINEQSALDLLGTYQFINQLRYSHHLKCLRNGEPVSNYLDPNQFGSFDRQHLKDAFRIISGFQDAIKMKFGC